MSGRLVRDLFLGFIELHILHHAGKEPIFGQEFREELGRHGYDISFGTLYPIFHRLEKNGYLKSSKQNMNGKIRRYYSITAAGKRVLNTAKVKARELANELFEE